MNLKEQIKAKAKELNILKVGIADAASLNLNQEAYLDTPFKYLKNNFEQLKNPSLLLKNAKSIITFAFNYYYPITRQENNPKISRYALGVDYHILIKQKMNLLLEYIKEIVPSFEYFMSIDGGKAAEKVWAEKSGIGWQGKHSLLITPEAGSWVFLSLLITNLELEPDTEYGNLCGNCRKCIDVCPTNAINKNGGINALKCISYNNIENRGETHIDSFHNYLYGCDICQEACPYNNSPLLSEIKEFQPKNELINISLYKIKTMPAQEFNELFADSSIKRIKLKTLQRNAEILSKDIPQKL